MDVVKNLVKKLTIIDGPQRNWLNAKAACEAKKMKLLVLPENDEIPALAGLIKENTFYWVGGHCPGSFSVTAFNILVKAIDFYRQFKGQ